MKRIFSVVLSGILFLGACSVKDPETPFDTDGSVTENFERIEKDFIPKDTRTIWQYKTASSQLPKGAEAVDRLYTYGDNKFLGNSSVRVYPNAGASTIISVQYNVAPLTKAPEALTGYTVTAYNQEGDTETVDVTGYKLYTFDASKAIGGSATSPRAVNTALQYSLIKIDGSKAFGFEYAQVDTAAKTIELQDSTPTEYKKV